jgi:hypothetical protein
MVPWPDPIYERINLTDMMFVDPRLDRENKSSQTPIPIRGATKHENAILETCHSAARPQNPVINFMDPAIKSQDDT